ncbi:MAG: UDP-N-acetylmuramoyl-tripeptide--D-alanyl-D-alanine ligase [Parcubacteria group bacterium]|nr:UDP-N-acetylmuramoyl-tripeptide--D-alanyl-D-alanine ligase [Parcubacteria group bacterium]
MKIIIKKFLKIISKSVLKKQKPKVIAVVGSVGKTSTKDAIHCVLENKFQVRSSKGSYNNELGVPLTILGEMSGGRNIFKWCGILLKGLGLALFKDKEYPQILVLELGVDKPGDMDYMLSFIKPDIACITAISEIPTHLKNFKNIDELVTEKLKVVENLSKDSKVVLNYDNRLARLARDKTDAKVITYGQGKKAEVRVLNIARSQDDLAYGQEKLLNLNYKLSWSQNVVPVRMPYILGKHQVYASLAAASCGIALGMNLVEISQNTYNLKAPKGRMNLLRGIKYTHIIDDSYNASPDSSVAALQVLSELKPQGSKIAILGDMLELGPKNEEGHRKVGEMAVESCDVLVLVGESSKYIADEAKKNGILEDNIHQFKNDETIKAAKFVQNKILKKGDLVLIKGSQALRMEKAVKELMAEPLRAPNLLVRQGDEWENK